MIMNAKLIYVTTGSIGEASTIARTLLDERLIACANIIDGMRSYYRWQGAVREDREAVLIVKTRGALVAAVIDRVKALHGYDCPCVVALSITDGNQAFLDWIAAETTAEGAR